MEGLWSSPLQKNKNILKMTKKIPTNTQTRDLCDLAAPTGNIYETVVILSKRANQIAIAEKKELTRKLEDFKNDHDTMEEVFENREQIEISKYYERQPKPSLLQSRNSRRAKCSTEWQNRTRNSLPCLQGFRYGTMC